VIKGTNNYDWIIIMDYQGFEMVIRGFGNGCQGFPMVIRGFQWLSGVSNGYQGFSKGFSMAIGDYHGFSIIIRGFQWLSEVFNGYRGYQGLSMYFEFDESAGFTLSSGKR